MSGNELIERLMTELDSQASFNVKIAEMTYQHAAVIGIITKLVIALFIFITITAFGVIYTNLQTKVKAPTVTTCPDWFAHSDKLQRGQQK